LVEEIRITPEFSKHKDLRKADLWGEKARLMTARTNRSRFLMPLIITLVMAVFVIGPGVWIVIEIINDMNPLVWIGALFLVLILWRKFVG
jgi:hypothetical protein